MVHRIEKGNDRHVRTGIHRAVEIVEDISNEALLGLTIIHSLNSFIPVSPECVGALNTLNDLYGRLIYAKLPDGIDWIEDLEILDAIRINPFGKFKTIKEYCSEAFNGIITIGIKKIQKNIKMPLRYCEIINFCFLICWLRIICYQVMSESI